MLDDVEKMAKTRVPYILILVIFTKFAIHLAPFITTGKNKL